MGLAGGGPRKVEQEQRDGKLLLFFFNSLGTFKFKIYTLILGRIKCLIMLGCAAKILRVVVTNFRSICDILYCVSLLVRHSDRRKHVFNIEVAAAQRRDVTRMRDPHAVVLNRIKDFVFEKVNNAFRLVTFVRADMLTPRDTGTGQLKHLIRGHTSHVI